MLLTMPDAEYFSNSYHNGGDYFTNSCMKLYKRSPSILQEYKRGMMASPQRDAFRIGTITHSLLLENKNEFVVAPEEYCVSTGISKKKPAQHWLAQQIAPVITSNELMRLELMNHEFKKHKFAQSIMEGAACEKVIRTQRGIWRQAKIDIVNQDQCIVADLKTCEDLDTFHHNIRKFNYIYQLAWYRRMYEEEFQDTPDCYLIAAEKAAPYRVGVFEIAPDALDGADKRISWDMMRLHTHLESNLWPTGYEEPRVYPFELSI